MPENIDVFVLGAGAAGLFCAIEAGRRGRRVVVLDHARRVAEKVRISGGGRCNFTNAHTTAANFLSRNSRFAISALSRYTPQHFIALVENHGIAYHEKAHGQLFCDESSQQIIDMLLKECGRAGVSIRTETQFQVATKDGDSFLITTSAGMFRAQSFVVASGGLSIPKMGATGAGYEIAKHFGIAVIPTRPALVPLTFSPAESASWGDLAGVSFSANVTCGKQNFRESVLFTHRGLSGPAILQISSYWQPSSPLRIDMAPGKQAGSFLMEIKRQRAQQELPTALAELVPRRLAQATARRYNSGDGPVRLGSLTDHTLQQLGEQVNNWNFIPSGTEGYRIAEVTLGGVDVNELSSKTMESKKVAGLFFIGEVVDVTGRLGGHNFQWAWSSAYAAGQAV